jgi:hypothetical protein
MEDERERERQAEIQDPRPSTIRIQSQRKRLAATPLARECSECTNKYREPRRWAICPSRRRSQTEGKRHAPKEYEWEKENVKPDEKKGWKSDRKRPKELETKKPADR